MSVDTNATTVLSERERRRRDRQRRAQARETRRSRPSVFGPSLFSSSSSAILFRSPTSPLFFADDAEHEPDTSDTSDNSETRELDDDDDDDEEYEYDGGGEGEDDDEEEEEYEEELDDGYFYWFAFNSNVPPEALATAITTYSHGKNWWFGTTVGAFIWNAMLWLLAHTIGWLHSSPNGVSTNDWQELALLPEEQKSDEQIFCAICQEGTMPTEINPVRWIELPSCRHRFHCHCLGMLPKPECPMCRVPFDRKYLMPPLSYGASLRHSIFELSTCLTAFVLLYCLILPAQVPSSSWFRTFGWRAFTSLFCATFWMRALLFDGIATVAWTHGLFSWELWRYVLFQIVTVLLHRRTRTYLARMQKPWWNWTHQHQDPIHLCYLAWGGTVMGGVLVRTVCAHLFR